MNLKFETERLILRPFELSDADNMFAMDSNPNVHTYLWQKPATSVDETITTIEYLLKQYQENKIGRYATFLKESGEFIGWTGIKYINDHVENGNTNFYDYGYRLVEEHWNKGYATEATKFWLEYGLNIMKIEEMNAYTHHDNGASNRVLSKNGFQFMEDYLDEHGAPWKWWQIVNKRHIF